MPPVTSARDKKPVNSAEDGNSTDAVTKVEIGGDAADRDLLALGRPRLSVSLEFREICYHVAEFGSKERNKQILHGIEGDVHPGEMLAVLGPSGGGKTSLLNVLGGRVEGGSGQVLINGKPRTKAMKRYIGYVLQEDIMFSKLTVRETLGITARLRLPGHLSRAEKMKRVDDIIQVLGLQSCQNNIVETISGGEKKRLNIGNELIPNPSLLMLDEPTSGLDSSTAFSLLRTLQSFCRQGRTILTTIHQPSSQIFAMFQRVMILADGHVVYFGSAKRIVDYFGSFGYPCPVNFNPADHVLELVTEDFRRNDCPKKELIEAWKKVVPEDRLALHQGADTSEAANASGVVSLSEAREGTRTEPPTSDVVLVPLADDEDEEEGDGVTSGELVRFPTSRHVKKWQSSWWEQVWVLAERSFKQKRGNGFTKLVTVEVLVVSIIGGLFWFQIDRREDTIADYVGVVFFLVTWMGFFSLFNALIHFPAERSVIAKERASGSYRLSAYFVAKTFAELPVELFFPTIAIVILYWFPGLNFNFLRFLGFSMVMYLGVVASSAIGVAIGCGVMDFQKSITVAAVLMLSFMLLGGFFVKQDNIPDWISWVKWLSTMRYNFMGCALMAIEGLEFDCQFPSEYDTCKSVSDKITGKQILEKLDIESELWQDCLILIVMTFGVRVLGYLLLRRSTSKAKNIGASSNSF